MNVLDATANAHRGASASPRPAVAGLLLAIPLVTMVLATGLEFRLVGDEGPFHLMVIDHFATRPLLDAVADYPSASTPLPYVLWTGFGRLFGFEVWILRLFGALVTYAAVLLFYGLARRQNLPYPLVSAGLLLFMPYVFFHALTVYTVGFGLLFGIGALHFYLLESPGKSQLAVGGLLATAAIYSRQYYLFLPVGMLLCELAQVQWNDLPGTIRRRLARWLLLALPLFALVPLVLYWRGLTAPHHQADHFVHPMLQHINFLPLFVGVYFFPALLNPETVELWRRRRLLMAAAIVLVPVYFAFPLVYNEDPNAIGAATGLIPHALEIVGRAAGGVVATAGCLAAWAVGLVILLAAIARRPWDASQGRLLGLLTAFMLLLTLTPYVSERYYMAAVPLLILLLYRNARRPHLLWVWLILLAAMSVAFSYWQLELKSFESWGNVGPDQFQVIDGLPE